MNILLHAMIDKNNLLIRIQTRMKNFMNNNIKIKKAMTPYQILQMIVVN